MIVDWGRSAGPVLGFDVQARFANASCCLHLSYCPFVNMSDEATPLTLPPRLSWPIRVRRICAQGGDEVQRGTRLLEYSFTSATTRKLLASAEVQGQDTRIKEYDMVGSWESPVEGKLERWAKHVEVGMVIDARSARSATFLLFRLRRSRSRNV